jgi:hypothetical protein
MRRYELHDNQWDAIKELFLPCVAGVVGVQEDHARRKCQSFFGLGMFIRTPEVSIIKVGKSSYGYSSKENLIYSLP